MTTASENTASEGTAFERAAHDPDLLERYTAEYRRAEYRGGAAPLDALWWLDRPKDATPAGTPSPAGHLTALRRAVYSPGALPASIAEYEQLSRQVSTDRESARAAFDAAVLQVEQARDSPAQPSSAAGTALSRGRRSRRRPLAAVAVGLAIVIAGIAVVAGDHAPTSVSHSQKSPSADAASQFSVRFKEGSVGPSAVPTTVPSLAITGEVMAQFTSKNVARRTGTLDGQGKIVTFMLICEGAGSVRATLSGQTRLNFMCQDGVEDILYNSSPKPLGKFSYALATSGQVAWSVTITRTLGIP